jgi:hypothetical protein
MTKVLVLSGRKQSGKTTCRNFLYGYIMKYVGVIEEYGIKKDGTLWCNAEVQKDGEKTRGMGLVDPDNPSIEFAEYASQRIWPFVKSYSFADELKRVAQDVFGLTYEQCHGTNDEKNSLTTIPWGNMFFALTNKKKNEVKQDIATGKRNELMTGREVLQVFGTEICRKIHGNCWVEACYRRIDMEQPNLAIITDARFVNEVETSLEYGASVVRLTRAPFKSEDEHESETALDGWDADPELRAKYSLWCDNAEMTIQQQNDFMQAELVKLGILPENK